MRNISETDKIMLSPKLSSPKAMLMWWRLQQKGYIDDHYQPVGLSRTEGALLSEEITILLSDENENLFDIKEWKPYAIPAAHLWLLKMLPVTFRWRTVAPSSRLNGAQ